jgi:hypothetical protein
MRARAAFVLMMAVALLALPGIAHASVWAEGTAARSFGLADAGGLALVRDAAGDPSLMPPLQAATRYNGTAIELETRSIRVDSRDQSLLVACGKHLSIQRIYANGTTRMYTGADFIGLARPDQFRPFDAYPLSDGGMIIVDRGAAEGFGQVFKVDKDLRVVWTFDAVAGPGAGQLRDPFTAEPLGNNRTLISDSLGSRIIEIDDLTGQVVWSYGQYRVPGPGPGLLVKPHSAQRLANGNTLICAAEGCEVIEVTPSGQVVWKYGTGTPGNGPGQVGNPNSAVRLGNGNTMISDSDNNRVIEVSPAGTIVQTFGAPVGAPTGGALANPRAATRLANGITLIADLLNMRIASYGYPVSATYTATSNPINPSVGILKAFSRVDATRVTPSGSTIALEYAVDNAAWKSVPANGALPANAVGSTIRYRAQFKTGPNGGDAAPALRDVSITWAVATPTSTGTTSAPSSTTKSTASSTGSSSSGTGTSVKGTGGTVTVLPSGSIPLSAGGFGDPSGQLGGVGVQSASLSGWVMSEVAADQGWPGGTAAGGAGSGSRTLQKTTVPTMALLLVAYSFGLAWAPTARLAGRLVALAAMTH